MPYAAFVFKHPNNYKIRCYLHVNVKDRYNSHISNACKTIYLLSTNRYSQKHFSYSLEIF